MVNPFGNRMNNQWKGINIHSKKIFIILKGDIYFSLLSTRLQGKIFRASSALGVEDSFKVRQPRLKAACSASLFVMLSGQNFSRLRKAASKAVNIC